jgi:hypothetical protein
MLVRSDEALFALRFGRGEASMRRRTCIGLVLAILLISLPGCSGCRRLSDAPKTPEEIEKERLEQKKREEEQAKPPFSARYLVSRPSDLQSTAGCYCKPGHWTCTAVEGAVANRFDFVGELEVAPTDRDGAAVPLLASPFHLTVCRDIALPKGQIKSLESVLLIPPGGKRVSTAYHFNAGRDGRHVYDSLEPLPGLLPSWQYHFVVFTKTPDLYKYLQTLDSMQLSGGLHDPGNRFYRVVTLGSFRRSSLPSCANQWTGIAYLLWDDAPPASLDQAQQQALLDWLHWGGQIIVSGPDTLDTLRGSFLAPYLPADSAGQCKLDQAELAALNVFSGKPIRKLAPVRPWSGVRLQKRGGAEFTPGAGRLLVERRVGRGRITVSAFRLSEPEWITWPGCDEAFHALLLHRPARTHLIDTTGERRIILAGGASPLDAAQATQLRYFVRDAGVSMHDYGADATTEQPDPQGGPSMYPPMPTVHPQTPAVSVPSDAPPSPGMAAWNDFSPVAQAARKSLQAAAGIEIPKRPFVLAVVVVYLLVLVPVNWAVFRMLRRVEWAWAAAPVIAVVCTVVVVRLAQLDIGFARSQTEVAVAEVHADYPRAHLTRYNALYTSLATSYDIGCDDPGAAALPLPTVARPEEFRLSLGQQVRRLTCRRGEQMTLSGLPVGSNSTALVHSEEMSELGGSISWTENDDGTCGLVNRSSLDLHGAGILRKTRSGEVQEAWIGEAPAGKSAGGARWRTPAKSDVDKPLWAAQREQSPASAANPPPGAMNLRKLLDLGGNAGSLEPGETRLVAWSDSELPGLTVEPAAPQVRRCTLVIVHLGFGRGEAPRPDTNLRTVVQDLPP